MTRWARVGNSQKHKKLPEDATPWENFWQNQNQSSNKDKTSINKVKSGRIEKKKDKQKKKFMFHEKAILENPENESNLKMVENNEEKDSHQTSSRNEINEHQLSAAGSTVSQGLSKRQLKKAKLLQSKIAESKDIHQTVSKYSSKNELNKEEESATGSTVSQGLSKRQLKKAKLLLSKMAQSNDVQDHNSSNIAENIEENKEQEGATGSTVFQGLSKRQLKKAKLLQSKIAQSNDVQDQNSSNIAENIEVSETDYKSPNEKDFQGKKKLYMQNLERKRKQNGILLLPAKIERKLYIIKRRLREKGLPPEAIRQIARKERRKEELKFRGSMSTKPCFNCRQIGHLLADCPMKLGKSSQETGICFKCGSAEHTSYKCPENIEGYPLAKCFVCKEQGHISKDCPKNEHGVYIKGGKCSLCGNVNHLKKDCPTLRKKQDEEADITAYTIHEGKSVDAEILPTDDRRTAIKIKKEKNSKVVKF